MSAVSSHKIYKLGSLSFPTFNQIETVSWAGDQKLVVIHLAQLILDVKRAMSRES